MYLSITSLVCNPHSLNSLIFLVLELDPLEHADENCWNICNLAEGKCTWCGTEGWCCQIGSIGNGCDGSYGGNNIHQCALKQGT